MPTIRYDLESVDQGFERGVLGGVDALGKLSVAAIAATGATKALLDDVFGQVDAMNTAAQATGLSAKSINGLRLAAKAANKDLGEILPTSLTKRMLDASAGLVKAERAFSDLGVEVTNADGSLRDVDVVFREVIDSLNLVEDATTRSALASQVLGEQGKNMLSAFDNSAGFDHFVELGEKFGIDVGPEAVAQSNAWWAATANLALAFEDAGQQLADVLAPGATKFVNDFALGFIFIKEIVVEVFEEIRRRFTEIADAATALRNGDLSALADLFDTPAEAVDRLGNAVTRAQLTTQEFWGQTMEGAQSTSNSFERVAVQLEEEIPEAMEVAEEAVVDFMDAWEGLDDQMQDIGRTIDQVIRQYERDTTAFEREQAKKKAAFQDFAFSTLTTGASSFSTLADLAHESALSQVESGKQATAAQQDQILKTFKTSQNAARAEVFFNAAAAFASLLVTFAALGYGAPIAAASITAPMVLTQLAVIDSVDPPSVRHTGGMANDEMRVGGMKVLQGEAGFVFNREAVQNGAVAAARAANERRPSAGGGGAQLVLADAGRAVATAMLREERKVGSTAFRAKAVGRPRARVNPYRRS